MKVTPKGFFIIYVVLVTSLGFFYIATVLPSLLLAVTKLTLKTQPGVLLLFFNYWNDFFQHMFIALMAVLLECVLQVRIAYAVVTKGSKLGRKDTLLQMKDVLSPPKSGKFKIILLNHRSRVDWMLLYPFLARTNVPHCVRFVLKEGLSRIPVFGWAMQLFRYMFLSRKWADDEVNMRQMIDYYKRTNGGCTIVIFPEGTDLSESNVVKSQTYAKTNGLPLFRYVLNPRSTGFLAMVNMIGVENIEELVDLTMGYTDFKPGERPSEVSVVNGCMPRKIHILCTRHILEGNASLNNKDKEFIFDVAPKDSEGLRQWLNNRFAKKELLLSQFYTSNPVGFESHHVKTVYGEDSVVLSYDEDEESARDRTSTKLSRFIHGVGFWRGFIVVIIFWSVPVFFWVMYISISKVLWCVICSLGCWWIVRTKGGIEKWLLFKETDRQHTSKKD